MLVTRQSLFRIHCVAGSALDAARSIRLDASGNSVVPWTASGGEPLRCCLRDARPAEALILFGYEPVLPASPYREVGAIFAHEARCEGPLRDDIYPAGWRGRAQVLRAYDERGWIHDAVLHDGMDPDAAIEALLADERAVQLHSRNVTHGCFMFRITRVVPEAA